MLKKGSINDLRVGLNSNNQSLDSIEVQSRKFTLTDEV